MTDLRIFHHWGYRLDVSPFLYLSNPEEAVNFISFWEIGLGVPAIFIFTVVFYYYFRKKIQLHWPLHKKNLFLQPVLLLVVGMLLIIPIRGGVGISVLNESSVYFSKNQFSNQAAINVFWNFVHALTEMKGDQKSYEHMPVEEAEEIVDKLYQPADSTRTLLKTDRPNVILIIMESMTRKLVYAKRDEVVITPFLNAYGKEGIYFSNFYGSGERTDKGLAGILSGQPAMPLNSILSSPKKAAQLPSLLKSLKSTGYHTSFYYGGDVEFGNMKSYILNYEPHVLIDKASFTEKDFDAKWGVHDHLLFEKVFEEIQSTTTPYFKTILTLSNHEPFDVPQQNVFAGDDPEYLFANAANYADKAMHDFIEKIRFTPQWENTLIIMVADHSTVLPFYSSNSELARFKIPMVWLGGALETGGMNVTKFGDQTDIARTLLNQLGMSADEYKFGKDLFAKDSHSFAYYAFNKGFGFVSDSLTLIYDNKNQEYLVKEVNTQRFQENIGKAFQQVFSKDYFEK
jgi:phosphoglycerol transferase MdoB-like AlkP superfamily enzyme